MTSARTHIFRLLKWGRVLARHGALRDLEQHKATPPAVKRLFRIARFGTIQPKEPRYAEALQALGPAAIKLGQTLATRPDVIGVEAAKDLLQLQDQLPPVSFDKIRDEIEDSLGKPVDTLYQHVDPDPVGAASIAQVHKAVTTEGKEVAVKVLRPGILKSFLADIDTYEWAAAHLEAFGGEAKRLRPQSVIANFRRWTMRELDLRREAAAASELSEQMANVEKFEIPAIDWDRTSGRVMTLDWVDGIKISKRDALITAGHDLNELANHLVHTFLKQAIEAGYFHADMHQGNLFVKADGTLAVIDFGIMGRINKKARFWLAEILYGLTTGNYKRVAEIHFEAQYVPDHHLMEDFANALRAVGEPMRGKPVHELSVGDMLDGLFAITRDFDMQTQPHLLLLQKTMVMVEGIATDLNPQINMWDTSGPYVKEWIRGELGPEAAIADALHDNMDTLALLPGILKRLDQQLPRKGAAPPGPPIAEVELIWDRQRKHSAFWKYALTALIAGAAGAAIMFQLG